LLLELRIGIAAVMLPWVMDRLIRPEHAACVSNAFYGMPGLGPGGVMALGIAQLLLVVAFVAGVARTWTYGAILALHAVTTFASWRQYLEPFEGGNLMYFGAWPMLAACRALFLLRDQDRLLAMARRTQ
jgi:putative oxidoreductase